MKALSPAKITIVSFIFLIVLYFTGGLDFAIVAVLITSAFLFSFPSVLLFVTSLVFFAFYIVTTFLSLKLDNVADLTISSYALFLSGIIIYFLQGQKKEWQVMFPFMKKINITYVDLFKSGGILFLVILIYPLTNAYIAAVLGYLFFLFVFKKNDGRYAFTIALFFLVLCPLLLFAKKDKIAETSAIFTYYFLVIGTVQEIIQIIRNPQDYEEEDIVEEEKEEIGRLSRRERIRLMSEKPGGGNYSKIVMAVVFLIVISVVFYAVYNFLILRQSSLISPVSKLQISPTITSSVTTAIPTVETPEASVSSALTMRIDNGTLIPGLVSSIAARLKEEGFDNIEIGNANRRDYKNWEIALKKPNDQLIQLLYKTFALKDAVVSEATADSRFDVEIIVGEGK